MAACWAPSSSSSWPWELSDAPGFIHGQPLVNYKQQQHQQQQEQQNSGCDPMGLRLGKRTYFEDSAAVAPPPHPRSSSAPAPAAPAPDHSSPVPVSRLVSSAPPGARKKQRGPSQPPATPSCQVEGCSADLSGSKGYHRRHRVCEIHSKTPKNMVGGIEQRFCQQCSRFHVLGEFDEGKRSCRRRLAGHNERRRKPPPSEAFALHHSGLLGVPGSPIFQADLLAHQQQHQQHHQHLLDGTFIVSPNGKSSWPDSTALLRGPIHHLDHHHHHHQQQQQQSVVSVLQPGGPVPGTGFFLKSITRDRVASQGVYQFLKCSAVAAAGSSSSSSSPLSTHGVLQIEPGIVSSSAGALSLLSAEPWSSSSSSPPRKNQMFSSQQDPSKLDSTPLFHLQLQHDVYHHHQQQQRDQDQHHHQQLQQQKFGLNEFMHYQKPLEGSLVFDA